MSAPDPGLPSLDFAWAGSTRVPAGSTYGPYTTAYWEFIWCMEGSAQVRSGDEEFEFSTGALQLTPPGVRNYYQWHPVWGTRYGYAIFTMPEEHPSWPRYRAGRADDIIAPLLDHVLWLDALHPHGWRESASIALAYAIRAFVIDASATRLSADHQLPEAIARSLDAVREQWDAHGMAQPALEEMAAAAGVTREYLCRVYARHVGMGPATSIRTLRLHRAAALLSNTNLGVAEIASHLGFTSEFQFSRSFRSASGQSPSGFRRSPDARLELPIELHQVGRHLKLL
jgi:AraC family transcriptional regulator of arabinose operon